MNAAHNKDGDVRIGQESGRQKVAFIGLGNMGGPMAANLAKAGFQVQGFDLVKDNLDRAVSQGCLAMETADAAVADVDFVVTMLPSGAVVESLYIDDARLLDCIPQKALVIDCSTVAPHNSIRLAQEAGKRQLRCIDAPVSGGVTAAAAGTLAFMCGGDETDIEAARPLLSDMGSNIFRAGDSGAGSVAKICNNMLLAIHMIGTAEALQLGVNSGLDPAVLSEIMLQSSGSNWSLEKYNPYPGVMEAAPASNNYQGGFMVKLMQKDLGLAIEAAQNSHSSTPLGALANSLYTLHGQEPSNGTLDFSSIQRLFQRTANT